MQSEINILLNDLYPDNLTKNYYSFIYMSLLCINNFHCPSFVSNKSSEWSLYAFIFLFPSALYPLPSSDVFDCWETAAKVKKNGQLVINLQSSFYYYWRGEKKQCLQVPIPGDSLNFGEKSEWFFWDTQGLIDYSWCGSNCWVQYRHMCSKHVYCTLGSKSLTRFPHFSEIPRWTFMYDYKAGNDQGVQSSVSWQNSSHS